MMVVAENASRASPSSVLSKASRLPLTITRPMSGLSSFLPFKGLGSSSPRDRAADNRLRSALETMPGTRKYQFTPNVRAEILAELYEAFWGPFSHLFLPNSTTVLPPGKMLSEVQISQRFNGAGSEDMMTMPGRSCNRIFKKGECCYRCK